MTDRTDILMLVNAKKMGLSLEELNQFIFADFIEFQDIYVGNRKERTISRKASQKDIDKFFA